MKLNGDVISWASKKQHCVSQSTCEAELYAEAAAVNEVLWLRGIMEELELPISSSSVVYCDNQPTISISKNGIKGERTKHVDNSSTDDESDGFEPLRVAGRPRNESGREVGPPITVDQKMEQLDHLHRAVAEDFEVTAKRYLQEVRFLRVQMMDPLCSQPLALDCC